MRPPPSLAFAALLAVGSPARGAGWAPPYVVAGQSTVVWQHLPPFRSPWAGPKSLLPGPENGVSDSYTLYTGVRPLSWLDLYVDPEMIRREGIGGGIGLAGYTPTG
jgi:high affinity Mn2+ porin